MADNPYQAPQTGRDVKLLPAWRRHLSLPLIVIGGVLTICLLLGVYITVSELVSASQLKTLPYSSEHKLQRWREFMLGGVFYSVFAPGLLMAGGVLRRAISWKKAAWIVVAKSVLLSAYFFSWWLEMNSIVVKLKLPS
jgi:hypothetical protein